MCEAALLSPAVENLYLSQNALEPLLLHLGVKLVRQDNWRRGADMPEFKAAAHVDKEEAGEIEDLTALSCDTES